VKNRIERARRIVEIAVREGMNKKLAKDVDGVDTEQVETALKNIVAKLLPDHHLANLVIEGETATFDILEN
jgi:hypothetical protein